MGSSPFKERIERGASSGIFTGDGCGADDWKDVYTLRDKLVKCRTLNLANNKFQTPLPQEVVAMPCFTTTLRVLDLSKNGIPSIDSLAQGIDQTKATDPAYVASLSKGSATSFAFLEKLDVSHNQLTSLPLLFLSCVPKLKDLNLGNNQLKAPSSVAAGTAAESQHWALVFAFGTSVVSVNLEANKLAVLPLSGWRDRATDLVVVPLLNVQSVNVSGNAIKQAAVQDHPMPQLRSINLSAQQNLQGVDPALYSSAPKLLEVTLDGNKSKEAIITTLRATAEYAAWVQRRASTVDRQLASGVDAQLAD